MQIASVQDWSVSPGASHCNQATGDHENSHLRSGWYMGKRAYAEADGSNR